MTDKIFDDFFTEEKIRMIYYSSRQDAADDLENLYENFVNNLPSEEESQKILKDWASFIVKQCAEIVRGNPSQDSVLRDVAKDDG